jgi:hypothetical protein
MNLLSAAMIRRFLTKLVSTVRTVVQVPILRKAVVSVIIRTWVVVDVLTGISHPRPVIQHLQKGSQTHVIPLLNPTSCPGNSTFFRQR